MAHIDLLPWREAALKAQQKEYFTILTAVGVVAIALVLSVNLYYQARIDGQSSKNQYLKNEIVQLEFGMSKNEAKNMLGSEEFKKLKNVSILGLMGMASFTNDHEILKKEFSSLNNSFKELSSSYSTMRILSMGMSDDYKLAIELGSNMIRVGSSIFGSRN